MLICMPTVVKSDHLIIKFLVFTAEFDAWALIHPGYSYSVAQIRRKRVQNSKIYVVEIKLEDIKNLKQCYACQHSQYVMSRIPVSIFDIFCLFND